MNKKLATNFWKWLDFFHIFNFDFSLLQILMCWGARSFDRCFLGWQINTTNRADSSHLIFLALNLHLKISGIYNRLVTNGLNRLPLNYVNVKAFSPLYLPPKKKRKRRRKKYERGGYVLPNWYLKHTLNNCIYPSNIFHKLI